MDRLKSKGQKNTNMQYSWRSHFLYNYIELDDTIDDISEDMNRKLIK